MIPFSTADITSFPLASEAEVSRALSADVAERGESDDGG